MLTTDQPRSPANEPNPSRYSSMKIKRFVAADMRSAMNLVRKEHGPDAVILSNRRIEEGVEIVAAAHYDESVVQRALETARKDTAPVPPAPRPRNAADAMIAAVTRRRTPAQEAEPVSATTSAVAALARAAVGATGRTLDSADEGVPRRGSDGFAATLAHAVGGAAASAPVRSVNEPTVPAEVFAPFASAQPAARPLPRAWVEDEAFAVEPALLAASAETESVTTNGRHPPAMDRQPSAMDGHAATVDRDEPAMDRHAPVVDRQATVVDRVQPAVDRHSAAADRLPSAVGHDLEAVDHPAAAADRQPVEASSPPVLTVVARDDEEIRSLRNEMAGMRQIIEREMHRFTDERLRGSPVRAAALDLMEEYGFDAGITRDVVLQIPLETEAHRGRGLMLGLISRKLPITPVDPLDAGGVIALVGPTGAGKTTTIAKLASRFAERHAPRDVALVTTDTARIGAREQLYGFGRQLGIAVHEANSGTDLDQLLERLKDYKLVLIDTAGVGPRDRTLASQLQWLRAARQVSTLLVLPANTSFGDMDEVVRRFSAANLQGVVLSKLDETGRFGTALSVAVDHRLPITWVTDGQDVPEDLHRASAANLVLRLEDLRRAADMPCNPELNHAVA